MAVETRNAIIRSISLRTDDHGLLSSWLDLDYGGSGQGFGGYCLYLPESFGHHAKAMQANFAGHWIWRVMEVADVVDWLNLPGKTVRVRCEHSKVHAIGHIVKDDWFNPTMDFQLMAPKNEATKGDDLCSARNNTLRDALSWFDSHEVEMVLKHLPQWVVTARALTSRAQS